MPLGFSIDNNDKKWSSLLGPTDVPASGGGFRAQAQDDEEQKKKVALDFNAVGNGNPVGYVNSNIWTQAQG